MEEAFGDELFEHRLRACHVLESLAITLEKMLQGSYISVSTAEKIMQEAANQYHNVLKHPKCCLPSHYIIGHLQHYKQSDNEWMFSVSNPIISLCINTAHTGARSTVAVINKHFGTYGGARVTSDMPLKAYSTAFCYPGTVKVRAIIEEEETS